jgi:hypothetical protein
MALQSMSQKYWVETSKIIGYRICWREQGSIRKTPMIEDGERASKMCDDLNKPEK